MEKQHTGVEFFVIQLYSKMEISDGLEIQSEHEKNGINILN
jgi:hypothetical protein